MSDVIIGNPKEILQYISTGKNNDKTKVRVKEKESPTTFII